MGIATLLINIIIIGVLAIRRFPVIMGEFLLLFPYEKKLRRQAFDLANIMRANAAYPMPSANWVVNDDSVSLMDGSYSKAMKITTDYSPTITIKGVDMDAASAYILVTCARELVALRKAVLANDERKKHNKFIAYQKRLTYGDRWEDTL